MRTYGVVDLVKSERPYVGNAPQAVSEKEEVKRQKKKQRGCVKGMKGRHSFGLPKVKATSLSTLEGEDQDTGQKE